MILWQGERLVFKVAACPNSLAVVKKYFRLLNGMNMTIRALEVLTQMHRILTVGYRKILNAAVRCAARTNSGFLHNTGKIQFQMWCGKIPFCLLLAGFTLLPTMENRAVPHCPALSYLALSPCLGRKAVGTPGQSWAQRASVKVPKGLLVSTEALHPSITSEVSLWNAHGSLVCSSSGKAV